MDKKEKALVVFSGGQDSTTCLFWAIKRFGRKNVRTATFDYGQRHRIELKCAKYIAKMAGVCHSVLKINTFRELGGNSLTGSQPVNNKRDANGLPNTFVPGRNLIFLTFGAALAYKHQLHHLVIGVCETDHAGYPDCRRKTIRSLEKTIAQGMDYKIRIHAPLISKTKAEAVHMAKRVGALPALAFSHTCYMGQNPPCGKCMACRLRKRAFKQAGIADPLLVRPKA